MYKSKFSSGPKQLKIVEETKPETANLDFENESKFRIFLEEAKNYSSKESINKQSKLFDIPKDKKDLPLDDSFSKVHDQDNVWNSPKPEIDVSKKNPSLSNQTTNELLSSTLQPFNFLWNSLSQFSVGKKIEIPWYPHLKEQESGTNVIQFYNQSPTVQNLRYEEANNSPLNIFLENMKKRQNDIIPNFKYGKVLELIPQGHTFEETIKYHNYHPTEYQSKNYGKLNKNVFIPSYNNKQLSFPKQVSRPIYTSKNVEELLSPTEIEYPNNLFSPVTQQYPIEPFPQQNLFAPAFTNLFTKNGATAILQPNSAILSIWEDAKRNKKHSRIRRNTNKIYHPNLLSTEEKRLVGVSLKKMFKNISG